MPASMQLPHPPCGASHPAATVAAWPVGDQKKQRTAPRGVSPGALSPAGGGGGVRRRRAPPGFFACATGRVLTVASSLPLLPLPAGQIGYAICPMIARGAMLGPDQPVILHMLDIEPAKQARPVGRVGVSAGAGSTLP